ncbi:MAG: carboxypeptidase-like regulatory domain-containing protein, partial [Planctomycetota bacterium]|nr:carboxypeptidase-like regulatory domain-containing protein [Planctomycetota bacterium]
MKQSDVALRACGRAIALGLLLVVATGASATVVSGRVTNVTGSGIANVDLDFVNRDTDENIPLVGDDTDPLGFYAVTVPVGDYDVRFNPPKGVRYAAHEERGVQVQGGSMTLDATLDDAWLVSGRVVDEFAAPLVNVDLDFVDMIDGGDAYVSNDSSDAAGQFTVAVRATTYQIEFEPPLGMPRAPRRLDDVVVSGDVALGDIVLDPGFTLSGVVRNGVATGLGSILVRTTDPWTGDEIFSIRNVTDGTGAYSFLVAAGNYTLELIPPRGARQLPRRVAGVAVSGALALPAIVLDDGVLVRGRVLDPGGSPAAGTDLDFVSALSDHRMWTPRDNADDGGDFE